MKIAEYKSLPYPRNLWSTVLGRPIHQGELPPDWADTLTHLFDSLNNPKKGDILLLYFKDNQTIRQIQQNHKGIYKSIRHHLESSVQMLQHPPRVHILEYGIKQASYMRENKLGFWSDTSSLCEDGHMENVLDLDIDVLGLNSRPCMALKRSGIFTVGDLLCRTKMELLSSRSLGAKSVNDIEMCLMKHRLSLRNEADLPAQHSLND